MRVTKQNESKIMFLTCIQTPPSAQIKKWGERRLWIAHVNRVPVYICIN